MSEIAKGQRDPRDGVQAAVARLRFALVSGLGGFHRWISRRGYPLRQSVSGATTPR